MLSASTAARRSMTSSSTRRIRTTLSNNRHLQHQRHHATKKQQRPHSTLTMSSSSGILKPPATKYCFVRPKNVTSNCNSNNRSLSSSAPPSSKPPTSASSGSKSGGGDKKQKTGHTEVVPNTMLAAGLFGFVTFVFLYSMNVVGSGGDGNAAKGEDPLAQLKAEAQEAREHRGQGGAGGRMTKEEIRAIESGVDVAASADIAALEDENNLKIFGKRKNQGKEPEAKKKAWWRFGF